MTIFNRKTHCFSGRFSIVMWVYQRASAKIIFEMEFHFFGIRSLATQCLMDRGMSCEGSGEPSTTAWPGKRDGKGARWPKGFLVGIWWRYKRYGDILVNIFTNKRSLGVSENGLSQVCHHLLYENSDLGVYYWYPMAPIFSDKSMLWCAKWV